MSTDYYLLDDANERTGPFKLEQISALWVEGTVSFDTLHWSDGMEDWKPLRIISTDIHAARVAAKKSPPQPLGTAKAPDAAKTSVAGKAPVIAKASVDSDWVAQPEEKKAFFNWNFLLNSSVLIFVLSVMSYFAFPETVKAVIETAIKDSGINFSNSPADQPRPVVVAPPPVQAPARIVAPVAPAVPEEPPQKYTLDEIKDAITSNLVSAGVFQNNATYDWQRVEYADDTDVRYEMLAHLPGGETKFCTGMVALNPHKHQITIRSQLSG